VSGNGDQVTPMHWSTMVAHLVWVIGRAVENYRLGFTAHDAIEGALNLSKVVIPIEIAARTVWQMMVKPVTDPTVHAIWLDALKTLEQIERKLVQS
jgi:hypothetical protein